MDFFLKNYIKFFIVAIVLAVFLWVLSPMVPVYGSDIKWYVAMAEGRFSEVIQPFSGRFLQPFITGQISSYLELNLNQSFSIISIISLISFFIASAIFFHSYFFIAVFRWSFSSNFFTRFILSFSHRSFLSISYLPHGNR